MTAAERQRRYRARQSRGEVAYRIDLPEHCIIGALIISGRLTEDAALRRHLVEQELRQIIIDWARRWKESRYA